MVKALTWRIGLSVGLFVLLIVAYYRGWIFRKRALMRAAAPSALQPVDEDEQAEPDHVDEVPVPGHRFEREVAARREMAVQHSEPDDRQHDRADGDVQAVKSGQHEERRTVDAGAELQSELRVGLVVLGRLQGDESEAQQERRRPERSSAGAVPGDQRVVRDRHGHAARQQDGRVDGR